MQNPYDLIYEKSQYIQRNLKLPEHGKKLYVNPLIAYYLSLVLDPKAYDPGSLLDKAKEICSGIPEEEKDWADHISCLSYGDLYQFLHELMVLDALILLKKLKWRPFWKNGNDETISLENGKA